MVDKDQVPETPPAKDATEVFAGFERLRGFHRPGQEDEEPRTEQGQVGGKSKVKGSAASREDAKTLTSLKPRATPKKEADQALDAKSKQLHMLSRPAAVVSEVDEAKKVMRRKNGADDNGGDDPRKLRALLGVEGRREQVVWDTAGRIGKEAPPPPPPDDPWTRAHHRPKKKRKPRANKKATVDGTETLGTLDLPKSARTTGVAPVTGAAPLPQAAAPPARATAAKATARRRAGRQQKPSKPSVARRRRKLRRLRLRLPRRHPPWRRRG